MTTGSHTAAALRYTSIMWANPLALVAVNVRQPAALAASTADMAECSLSAAISRVPMRPVAASSAKRCMSSVCGVIGYAAATCGLAWPTAHATASLPVSPRTRPCPSGRMGPREVGAPWPASCLRTANV